MWPASIAQRLRAKESALAGKHAPADALEVSDRDDSSAAGLGARNCEAFDNCSKRRLPDFPRLQGCDVEQDEDRSVTGCADIKLAKLLRLAGLEGAALDLNAFDFSVPAPRRVMSWCAGRRQLEAQCACGDVFRHLAGHAEWFSGELLILNREGLGRREDLANAFHFLRLAHALRRSGGAHSEFV
jgi:hypothetical protein